MATMYEVIDAFVDSLKVAPYPELLAMLQRQMKALAESEKALDEEKGGEYRAKWFVRIQEAKLDMGALQLEIAKRKEPPI